MPNPPHADFTRAAVFDRLGEAAEVLAWKEIPLPPVGPRDALVALECAVIHPSDFGLIAGTYGRRRTPPAVAGREGVGRVERVGPGVTRLQVGDRVRMPSDEGVWRERGVFAEDALLLVPGDLAPEAAAQSFVNPPAAIRVLEDFVSLNPGDIVVQNAGNSAAGRAVAFIARQRGVRTISLVRDPARHADSPAAPDAEVVADDDDAPARIAALKGAGRVRLALNSVGGKSVMRLIKACDPGATVVTFGGMTGDPVRFPTRELIFNDLTLRGFWLDRWHREASPAEAAALAERVYGLWRSGLPTGVEAVYPVSDILAAVKHAAQPGRSGKVLVKG